MPQLDNPRHEAFCQAMAEGKMQGAQAYRKVYGEDKKGAKQMASAMLKLPDIAKRVAELSKKASQGAVLTLQEEMEYLTRAILTPIDQIDERSILCQRVKYSETGRELWMVDKLRAMELLCRLKRELSEKQSNVAVNVAVNVLAPEQQKALQERKLAAIERRKAARN